MFCTQCGVENRDDARYCFRCGFDLAQSVPPPITAEDSESESRGDSSIGSASTRAGERRRRDIISLTPGAVVGGRYRVERFLGRGGMGSVFLCTDERMNRRQALKFISPRQWRSASAYRRFIQEANVCLDLTHSNIIRVYHLDEWNGMAFLAMEFLPGATLKDTIRQAVQQDEMLTWDAISKWIQQILSAVVHAHGKGVVHRDLKPSNIMLAKDGDSEERAVVMDFGLAKSLTFDGNTRAGAALGTPIYMAPEQDGSAEKADERSDIYSLAILAYEMVAGEPPRGRTPPLPSSVRHDLPPGIDSWIFRGIEPDPAHRFATANDMLVGFKALIDHATRARPAKAATSPAPTVRADIWVRKVADGKLLSNISAASAFRILLEAMAGIGGEVTLVDRERMQVSAKTGSLGTKFTGRVEATPMGALAIIESAPGVPGLGAGRAKKELERVMEIYKDRVHLPGVE